MLRVQSLLLVLAVFAILAVAVPAIASCQEDTSAATSDSDIGDVFSFRLISMGGGAISPGTGGAFDLGTLGLAWTWGMDIDYGYSEVTRKRTARGTPFTFGVDLFNVDLGDNTVLHFDLFADKAVLFDTGSSSVWFTLSFGGRTGIALSIVTDSQGYESTVWYLPVLGTANLRLMFANLTMYLEMPIGPAFKIGAPSRVNNDDNLAPGSVFVFLLRFGISLDF